MSRVRDLASILTASSSMATDAEVSAVSAQIPTNVAGKNFFINGGMDIWQRGTSFTGGQFTADRWTLAANSGTLTASRSTDVPSNLGFSYSYSMGGTGLNTQIYTRLESLQSARFAGQTVTYSVYAKSTAGSSPLSYVGIYPTATDDWSGSNVTDIQGNFIATPAGAWTRYSVTFTVNALATRGYDLRIYRNGTETSTTLLTGIQLEIGSVATPFSRAGGNIQGELAACQRYYYRHAVGSMQPVSLAFYWSATQLQTTIPFPVTMRAAPTLDATSGTSYYRIGRNSTAQDINGFALSIASQNAADIYNNGQASGTAGWAGTLYTINASSYIGFAAEL